FRGQRRISPIYTEVLAVKPFLGNFLLIRVIRVFAKICTIRVLTPPTQRLSGAVHPQYRQEALRCERFLRATVGDNVDATGTPLPSRRSRSSGIRAQYPPVWGDPGRP